MWIYYVLLIMRTKLLWPIYYVLLNYYVLLIYYVLFVMSYYSICSDAAWPFPIWGPPGWILTAVFRETTNANTTYD